LSAVLRFGRLNRIAKPGLNLKLPFGLEKNYNVPAQVVLKEEFGFRTDLPGVNSIRSTQDFPGESIMLTGDLNIVDVEWIIQYRIHNEGQEAYNRSIPKSKGQADQFIQETEGYAIERVNEAEGDVARYLKVLDEYNKSPGVTRTRLYYEMYEAVFADAKNVDLIGKSLGNFVPFKALNTPLPGAQGGAQ
jgi:regulator of protease activity HflC (stomatin/prohibitin superfamily)